MRIGRAHGRLVIIDGEDDGDVGLVDVATVSGGEFSADPDQVFAVWDRFTEWASRYAGRGAPVRWCPRSSARRCWPRPRCSGSA